MVRDDVFFQLDPLHRGNLASVFQARVVHLYLQSMGQMIVGVWNRGPLESMHLWC